MVGKTSDPGRSGAHRIRLRDLAIIFALALAFRLAYLHEASSKPDFGLFYMDQEIHLRWAEGLNSGVWSSPFDRLREGPYFRAPLYPRFLALLLRATGGDVTAARALQLVMGALSASLAAAVATKAYGRRAGRIAGLLSALSWVLAYFDGELLLPVLLVFLSLAGTLLLFLALERRNLILAAAAGLAFGLFAITRPNILVFFPVALFWLVRTAPAARCPRRLFVPLFAGAFLLPPAAVTARNGIVGGDWVVVASQGGVNFYIGNNPRSNGMEAVVPGTRSTWWGGFEDTERIAEESEGRPLKASEVSAYWFREAFRFIRDEPGRWLRLTGRKGLALVGNVELPNNEPYEARRGEYVTLRASPVGFALLLGTFLVSLFLPAGGTPAELRRRLRAFLRLFVAVYALTIVAFFVTGRYRVPLVPFLAVGAAATFDALAGDLRSRRFGRAFLLVGGGFLLTLLLSADPLGVRASTRPFAELTRAQDMLDGGDPAGAAEILSSLVAAEQTPPAAAFISLIRARAALGGERDRAAIRDLAERGWSLHPEETELLWFVAVGRTEAGDWERAREAIAVYSQRRPDDIRGLWLGFTAARETGRAEEAERYFRRAEKVDGAHPLVARMKALRSGDGAR
ncbi:MAG: glycosyltransferase family 39 protein [Candidatus Eisenbacteria bacterium]